MVSDATWHVEGGPLAIGAGPQPEDALDGLAAEPADHVRGDRARTGRRARAQAQNDVGRVAGAALYEILAVSSAFCVALAAMLVAETGGRLGVLGLARLTMVTAFVMTGSLSMALAGWRTLTPETASLLAGSSDFAIMLATLTYYGAIREAGPALASLMYALTSPTALLLGWLARGQHVTPQQAGGIACVLVGVALTVGVPGGGTNSRVPWRGVALGIATALGQAIGNLLAQPAMASGVEPFTAMAVRAGLGAAFFAALETVRRPVKRSRATLRACDVSLAVCSALVGTGIGMTLLMTALGRGDVGVVTTLASTTPIAILPLVWIRTRRRPTKSAWVGASVAVLGIALVSLHDQS